MQRGEMTADRAQVGRSLSWEEACRRIGKVILYEIRTQSMTYWMAVRPLRFLKKTQRFYISGVEQFSDRLICDGRGSHLLYIDEHYEPKFYEVEEAEP